MSKKILLADDSVTIQKIVELTFEGEGFDLEVVADGNEALKLAEGSPPDIILADLTMPGLSGIELCRKVRDHSSLASIPVILLTNSFEEFNRSDGDDAGISAYVEKPFESQALIDQVRELLSGEAAPPASEEPQEELQPPADEVDLISEEPEELLTLEEDEGAQAEDAAIPESAEDISLLEEEDEELLDVEDLEAVEAAEGEPEAAPPEALELAESASGGPDEDVTGPDPDEADEVVAPQVEAGEEKAEALALGEESSDELYELEKEPAPEAFTSMMDSAISALGNSSEDEWAPEPPDDETAAVAAAGAALEEAVGDAIRSYIDLLIQQAVDQLTPTITEKIIERLEASFPPLAERIIREEIERLKQGD